MGALLLVMSGLAAALVVYLLSRAVKGTASPHESRYWVAYGPAYKVLSAAFFPLSAFVTYAAVQAAPDQKTLALIIAACFWIGTLYLAYEFFFVRLSYDDAFVYHQTPLRGSRRIPMSAVKTVSYSPATQAFTIKTDGYGDIAVSPFADGHRAFIERISAQIDANHRQSGMDQA